MGNKSSAQSSTPSLPIDSTFNLPSPLPSWPSGEGFGKGRIDLGGLEVFQVETFNKVWTVYEGGQDNLGATFFEPSSVPEGFTILGFYAQPNNRKLFGWTLVGKDLSGDSLRPPVDFLLLWSGKSTKVENNGVETGFFWQPVPPDGYNAVGLVVTTSGEKPPLDKIRCVRSDLTDQSESDNQIWESNGFSVSSSKPINRGTQASGVCVGTFFSNSSNPTLPCLKNNKFDFSCMPSKPQIDALFQAYAPWIYFHKDEKYLPSSVNWFFSNGALLYKNGDESNPVPVEPNGLNLPQGESNDGLYWLDLPVPSDARKRVQGGDLQSMEVYLHIKPVFGGTFTDIAVWMFYPFNGPSRAKLKAATIPLGKIGEHIGDWEHFTLRISNFNGKLYRMYLSQHSGGSWTDASEIEFQGGGNKPVAYASLNGHAMYSKPGLVLQGKDNVGIRNDTGKSEKVIDTAVRFRVVAAEYMRGEVEEPAWLNYMRHWGPKIDYGHENEIRGVEKIMVGESLKNTFRSAVKGLPNEVFGEEGPTGPKLKRNWLGDED
ncbi:Vacuolar protein sorting-associated protein 62 [Arabidopsis thaliana x Arabidopsis arenosa]|uniref:Vacuolar protein sorting-associated protein 62 n=1 Tax=Arabidopsis thaliana x Arabidopsis arenosa TaxID=1240361 RepID=A0A8T2ABV8_9BRAS|nr:Vacuolar protein sorting-associated protein 62 [Arabidopsis thaliana x Arabidopsis arenosa]